MKHLQKFTAIMLLTVTMGVSGATTSATEGKIVEKVSEQSNTPVKVNDTIITAEGKLVVTEIGDGYYVAREARTRMSKVKCKHRTFMDVGKPTRSFRPYNSTKHELSTKQRMVCRTCKKYYTVRFYDIRYQSHIFGKDNVCSVCNYKKVKK